MSVEDVAKIKSAYEKMLEDGTANRKIDMPMVIEPSLAEAEHGLGDRVKSQPVVENNQPQEREDDWSAVDAAMERRINNLKAKMNGQSTSTPIVGGTTKRILALEKKVERLEKALMLVMETHEQLL